MQDLCFASEKGPEASTKASLNSLFAFLITGFTASACTQSSAAVVPALQCRVLYSPRILATCSFIEHSCVVTPETEGRSGGSLLRRFVESVDKAPQLSAEMTDGQSRIDCHLICQIPPRGSNWLWEPATRRPYSDRGSPCRGTMFRSRFL